MTRRRFVKVLMSVGWSRNMANKAACTVRVSGKTYAAALQAPLVSIRFYDTSLMRGLRILCQAIDEAKAAFDRFSQIRGDPHA